MLGPGAVSIGSVRILFGLEGGVEGGRGGGLMGSAGCKSYSFFLGGGRGCRPSGLDSLYRLLSEPPKSGRKTGAARKLSKSVENILDTFGRFFDFFCPARKLSQSIENTFDTFWRILTWPLSAGPSCGPLLIGGRGFSSAGLGLFGGGRGVRRLGANLPGRSSVRQAWPAPCFGWEGGGGAGELFLFFFGGGGVRFDGFCILVFVWVGGSVQ